PLAKIPLVRASAFGELSRSERRTVRHGPIQPELVPHSRGGRTDHRAEVRNHFAKESLQFLGIECPRFLSGNGHSCTSVMPATLPGLSVPGIPSVYGNFQTRLRRFPGASCLYLLVSPANQLAPSLQTQLCENVRHVRFDCALPHDKDRGNLAIRA